MKKLIHAKEIYKELQKKNNLSAQIRSKKAHKTIIQNMDLLKISEDGSNDSNFDKNLHSN